MGDGGKTVNNARKFVTHNPGKARELGTYVSRQILPYTPNNFGKVEIWDVLYDGVGSRLVKGDVVADDVLNVVNKISREDRHLSEVINILKRDGSVVYLETGYQTVKEGRDVGYGWTHIYKKHITGDVVGGDRFPTSMSPEQVQNLIYDSVKHGTPTPHVNGRIEYLYPVGDGRNMITVVSADGGIITSYPIGSL